MALISEPKGGKFISTLHFKWAAPAVVIDTGSSGALSTSCPARNGVNSQTD